MAADNSPEGGIPAQHCAQVKGHRCAASHKSSGSVGPATLYSALLVADNLACGRRR